MKLEVGIIKEEKSWRALKIINKPTISKLVKETLLYFPYFKNSTIELAILFTNDSKIQKLNLEFLKKDKPTNVLSFPDHEIDKNILFKSKKDNDYIYIGDIALGFETIEREALEKGISIYHHVAHMLIHGILHLIGFDHQIEMEEEEMKSIEVQILKNLCIGNPY